MDMNMIMTLVGTLGFPIVVSMVLSFVIMKMSKDHKAEIEAITKSSKDEVISVTAEYHKKADSFTEAINNNTKVMEKFIEIAMNHKEV